MSFEQSLEYLLKWEGGWTNNPHDPGGATNLGIIQTEYDAYRKRKGLQIQSVRHITKDEAAEIYKKQYWDPTHCDELNPGLANCLLDAAVNSGPARGVEWLQQAINQVCGKPYVHVDGKMSPAVLVAVKQFPVNALIDALLDARLAFMKVAKNPKTGELLWATFGHGWNDRIIGVHKQSHALAGSAPAQPLPPQIGVPTMPATAAAPAAPVSPIATHPAVAAAIQSATLPLDNIWTKIMGMFSSAAWMGLGGAFSTLAPTATLNILGALGVAAGLVSLIAHAYGLITRVSATNNATIMMAETMLQQIEAALGGKPFVFDNAIPKPGSMA